MFRLYWLSINQCLLKNQMFYYNKNNKCTKIYHPNFEFNLWKIKEISDNWCQNSAVNYHIKLVNPDHKIAIKISYLIEFYFFLFLHNLYMFVNKKHKYDINLWEFKRITGDQIPDSAFNSAVNYLFLLTGAHKIVNKWIICQNLSSFEFYHIEKCF